MDRGVAELLGLIHFLDTFGEEEESFDEEEEYFGEWDESSDEEEESFGEEKTSASSERSGTRSTGSREDNGGSIWVPNAQFFNKDRCVRHHEEHRLVYSNVPFVSASLRAKAHPASSKALEQLKIITLPDLVLEKRHYNRVLYGKLCVKAFRMSATFTVLEDTAGRAVRVAIHNISPSVSQKQVAKRYPVNTNVAIKEPYFKSGADGRPVVRVEHAEDIVLVYHKKADSNKANVSKLAEALEKIRAEGNQLFRQGDWKGAANKYTACIDQANGTRIAMPQDCNSQLLLAYSNRAEARLRLKAYKDALSDSTRALELDPKHVKTIIRKGSAEHALGLFKVARKTFSDALALAPKQDRSSILERFKASETAFLQCRNG